MRRIKGYPQRNSEGYPDPTAYGAMNQMQTAHDEEEERLKQMVKTVKNIVDLAGFELIERIQVKDKKSGRVYK